jgi:hypothetical protein
VPCGCGCRCGHMNWASKACQCGCRSRRVFYLATQKNTQKNRLLQLKNTQESACRLGQQHQSCRFGAMWRTCAVYFAFFLVLGVLCMDSFVSAHSLVALRRLWHVSLSQARPELHHRPRRRTAKVVGRCDAFPLFFVGVFFRTASRWSHAAGVRMCAL